MPDLKTPPQNIDAEESVLGAILLDKEAIVQIADKLEADHFYLPEHQMIFEAMVKLFDDRDPIDVVTLTNQLKKMKKLSEVGGTSYLAKLASRVPTAAHIAQYAKIVRDLWVKRSLISLSADLGEMAFDPSLETDQILDRTEKKVFGLSQQQMRKSFVSLKKALSDSFDRLDELHKHADGLRGISTGFLDLDNTLAGMQKSNLLILAARPGIGKTTFAGAVAHHAAVVKGMKVGYFALEMSTEEMVDRLLVLQADIDAWRLKTGRLDENDFEKLSEAMGVLAEAPLFFDDTPGQTVLEVRTKARRLMAEQGLDLIIVDYLQLMQGYTKDNRVQEVSEISQGLKNLARELKVPVLALSQLNRSVESRGTKQPQLSDLRESGSIEQDADVVMFLYREEDEAQENVKLTIAKHRNGPLRTIDLFFKGDRIKFYGMEHR
jgi:replicative DNA helicase